MNREARDILNFWCSDQTQPYWFKKDPAFDAEIRRLFLDSYERAMDGKFTDWQKTPEGSLALLILLDQFPRNMFRGTPRAFASDELARKVADWAVDRDFDLKYPEQQRIFFYLPFEHSEELDDQHRAVELVVQRCNVGEYLRYALAHRDVIARFGRFPHRNDILGRRNTPDEEDYLRQPGAGF